MIKANKEVRLAAIVLVSILAFVLNGAARTQIVNSKNTSFLIENLEDTFSVQLKSFNDSTLIDYAKSFYKFTPSEERVEVLKDIVLISIFNVMKDRNTDEITKSGIMVLKYNNIDLSLWSDDELINLYVFAEGKLKSVENAVFVEEHSQKFWKIKTYEWAIWIIGDEVIKRNNE